MVAVFLKDRVIHWEEELHTVVLRRIQGRLNAVFGPTVIDKRFIHPCLRHSNRPVIALNNMINSPTKILSKLTSISMIWKSRLVRIRVFRVVWTGYSYRFVKWLYWYHNLMIVIILCVCIFCQSIIEWNTHFNKRSISPVSLSKNIKS